MSDAIRIAIVDDHPFFRAGVERALRRAKDVLCVAEGASADDACRIAQTLKPDIMLLDISMPGGGIEATSAVVKLTPSVRIIILTGLDDDENVRAALAAGATGFLLKGADTDELMQAVRAVAAGRPFVTPALSSKLLLRVARTPQPAMSAEDLTRREEQILDAAAKGSTNQEISAQLGIALPTVKNYMSRIFEKLGVRNRAEAVAAWLRK